MLELNANDNTSALYIEGVGTTKTAPITGSVLGRGMEQRILEAYTYLANSYNKGDKIFILGFSRGALQARSIAGLVAYAGLPERTKNSSEFSTMKSNAVIEIIKNYSDKTFFSDWKVWVKGSKNPLADKVAKKLEIPFQSTSIEFVGVWDTVPGTALTNFNACKQNIGFWKKNLHWALPGINKGERYKTDSYPNIAQISHAVSIDEKRSKFKPLLVCSPILAGSTVVNEMWFPGAHADVGGGYSDSVDLSSISLDWMIKELSARYEFRSIPKVSGKATGLAHWSMGDSPANALSKCVDREIPNKANIHPSYDKRVSTGSVPIQVKGVELDLKYPLKCHDTTDNKADFGQ